MRKVVKQFMFGYQNVKQFMKVIVMELFLSLFDLEDEGDENTIEYNKHVAYFIMNLVLNHNTEENKVDIIDDDKIAEVKNILSSLRNKNRKRHHEDLDADSKMAKKAFRAIGLGVEFNELHDFKTTINVDENMFDSKTEYVDSLPDDGAVLGDDKVGIIGFVGGEDYNDELETY